MRLPTRLVFFSAVVVTTADSIISVKVRFLEIVDFVFFTYSGFSLALLAVSLSLKEVRSPANRI